MTSHRHGSGRPSAPVRSRGRVRRYQPRCITGESPVRFSLGDWFPDELSDVDHEVRAVSRGAPTGVAKWSAPPWLRHGETPTRRWSRPGIHFVYVGREVAASLPTPRLGRHRSPAPPQRAGRTHPPQTSHLTARAATRCVLPLGVGRQPHAPVAEPQVSFLETRWCTASWHYARCA